LSEPEFAVWSSRKLQTKTPSGHPSVEDDGRNERRALAERLDRVYAPVQEELDRVNGKLRDLTGAQSPYLAQLLDHVLETTGKGVRPAITLLASRFHPNDGRAPLIMAAAVELLHIATLIHDDTVDNSDVRRGKATVSRIWGRNAAVLLGDYIFATSATFVCDTGNIRVIRRFSETIMELSTGELNEMAGAYNIEQTRKQYFQRIYDKTASLFTTAAESGAVLSGASEDVVQALKAYGYNLGMAFQVTDDIMDFEGSSEEIGKPVGSDLAQGILTLPALIAIERNPDDNPIATLCRRPADAEALRQAVELVQDPSIMEEAFAVADQYSRKALDSLAAIGPAEARDSLEDLVAFLVRRRS
jgi:geranylgeranyl pyrophosphate synthase